MLDHNYIGTEHILLGLVHEGEGVAAQALDGLGVELDAVRSHVEEIIGQGQDPPTGHIPFTPRAKKVLELSLREALQLGHTYIGTEHLLLGLVREGEGVAAQVLQKMGADLSSVRQKVIELVGGASAETIEGSPPRGEKAGLLARSPRCSRCRADLAEHISFTVLTATEHRGEGTREVIVSFCNSCGTALGAWGA